MSKKFKFIYLTLGIILIISYVFTGASGLSQKNIDIHKNALNLQDDIDKLKFKDFNLKDYPITFFDGKKDYVFYNGDVEVREPVLNTFVGTAYPVDDHYEVLVPTLEKLGQMVSLFSGFSINQEDFGEEEHISTIWHEGFHAYQLTKFKNNIINPMIKSDENNESLESLIVSEVDNNIKIKDYYIEEIKLLKSAVESNNIDEIKDYILQYKKLDDERKSLLSDALIKIEDYYELIEGTAYYVESYAYKIQYDYEKYYDNYIDNLDEYLNGASKYYRIGMAKALILDKLSENWKSQLDFSKTLSELLCQ